MNQNVFDSSALKVPYPDVFDCFHHVLVVLLRINLIQAEKKNVFEEQGGLQAAKQSFKTVMVSAVMSRNTYEGGGSTAIKVR